MEAIPPFPANAQVTEAWHLMTRVEPDTPHALHVFKLLRDLISSCPDLHRLSGPETCLLESAALLHDIGWVRTPDGSAHHKHSAAMIREHPWRTFTPEQIEIIALLARYHRKKLPTLDHPEFAAQPPATQDLIRRAAAFLRLADALDRSHRQIVTRAQIFPAPRGFTLALSASTDIAAEQAAVAKKSDLFLQQFGGPLHRDLRAHGGRDTGRAGRGRELAAAQLAAATAHAGLLRGAGRPLARAGAVARRAAVGGVDP
ncbi:MAG: HD domain-containing protein, partial [Verrucomicrobiia bacterium]